MSTKIDQLVTWCRTANVIPANGTRARNDLADLVMGQPIDDIKTAFKVFRDEPDSVKRWVWLVTNVCDFESGIDLIYRTVLSYKWYQLQLEHEEEIAKGWNELNTARRKLSDRKSEIDERERAMVETKRQLDAANSIINEQRGIIYSLRSEIDELNEIKAEHDAFVQALRRGMKGETL